MKLKHILKQKLEFTKKKKTEVLTMTFINNKNVLGRIFENVYNVQKENIFLSK